VPLTQSPDHTFAVVTPLFWQIWLAASFWWNSLKRIVTNIPHYRNRIVDRCDRSAFAHLQSGQRRLIESEEILGIERSPVRKPYWLSLKAVPVRGWIIQQILKIGVLDFIPERTFEFCDSDTAFFRPFDRHDLLVSGKLELLEVDDTNDDTRRWTIVVRRLLALPSDGGRFRKHVGNVICWNREIVKALQERIECSCGSRWKVALARTLSISEYMIYGVFVCKKMWDMTRRDRTPSTVALVKALLGRLSVRGFGHRDVLQGFRCAYSCCDDPIPRRNRCIPVPTA
jgi:hypothetical protein